MPADWTRPAVCWMAWPCRNESFYDIDAARVGHALVAREINRCEPVRLILKPEEVAE